MATKDILLAIYNRLYSHYGHHRWWPGDTPFEIMVGAILTQNTAWANVEKAINNLKTADALTPERMYALSLDELAVLIKPSGFFNVKARRLSNFLMYLHERYSFDLDRMASQELDVLREELLTVKGIGQETADSILLYACEKPSFVIDSYTKRVLSRHSLCAEDDSYGDLKSLFEDNLPSELDLYNDFHAQIVNCCKDFCKTKPVCAECPLSDLKDM